MDLPLLVALEVQGAVGYHVTVRKLMRDVAHVYEERGQHLDFTSDLVKADVITLGVFVALLLVRLVAGEGFEDVLIAAAVFWVPLFFIVLFGVHKRFIV